MSNKTIGMLIIEHSNDSNLHQLEVHSAVITLKYCIQKKVTFITVIKGTFVS